jgi:hypothetical protein
VSGYKLPPFPKGTIKIRRIRPEADGTIERSPVATPAGWWDSVMADHEAPQPTPPPLSFRERNAALLSGADHLWSHESDSRLSYQVTEMAAGEPHEVRAACLTIEAAQAALDWLKINRGNIECCVLHVPTVEKIPWLFANVEVWTDDDLHIDFRFAKTNSRDIASLLFKMAASAYPSRIVRARHRIQTFAEHRPA